MVRHDCAVSHAIVAEFVVDLLDVRLSERPQPPERAMPVGVGCRKFAMRPEGGQRRYSESSNFASRRIGGAELRRGRSSRAKRSDGGLGRAPEGGPEREPAAAPVRGRSKLRAGVRGLPPASRASRITILSASFTASESRNTRATSGSSAMAPLRAGARRRSPKGVSRTGSARGGRSARWYGSPRLKSRGVALAAPNLRSIAARARGPLRVPAGASRSLPRFLSSKRFINYLGRCLLISQFTPQDLADIRLRQVRTELDVLRFLVAG